MTITITFKDDRKYRHYNSRYMIFESIRFIDIFQDAIEGKQERKTIHYNLDEIKKIEFIEPEPKIEKMRSEQNCSCSDCLDIIDKHIKDRSR